MPGIDDILNIATQAVVVHRAALEVIGHNVANANTPGYSRQKVLLENNVPVDDFFGRMGTGVFLRSVMREADVFLNSEIFTNTSTFGNYDARGIQLQRIEQIFNESTDTGISKAINEFFAAWNDLANKPEGMAERSQVLEKGKRLRDSFRIAYDQLDQVNRLLSSRMSAAVSQINTLAQEIRSLNIRVANTEGAGNSANDERDLREQRMKELAGLVSFQSYEDPVTKMVNITVGGLPLVAGKAVNSLSSAITSGSSSQINFVRKDGSTQDITKLISGGQLKGLVDLRNTIIPAKQSSLNTLAREVMEEVNRLHSSGVGLDTDGTGRSAGFTSISSRLIVQQSLALGTAASNAGSPFTLTDGGTFTLHAYDATGTLISQRTFAIDSNNDSASFGSGTANHQVPAGTLFELASSINTSMGAEMTATVSTLGAGDGRATLTLARDGTASYFTFSEDSSDFLSVFGLNTFFTGTDVRSMDINPLVNNDVNHINAAMVDRRDFMSNASAYGPGAGIGFSLGLGSAFTPGTFALDVYDAEGTVIETRTITVSGGADLNTLGGTGVGAVGLNINDTFENLEASVNGGGTLIGIRARGLGAGFSIRNATTSILDNLRMTGPTPGPLNFSRGDNRTALSISDLERALLLNNGTQTFSEYYSDFSAQLGSEVQNNDRNRDQQELVVQQLEGFRDARAGVNLDEELARLVKFEQAYNAAARLVVLVQELTDRLLNAIGA